MHACVCALAQFCPICETFYEAFLNLSVLVSFVHGGGEAPLTSLSEESEEY